MLDMIASQTSIPSQTKSNEWYTPSKYIEAAREVMGSIDLDPASCELANQTVKASRYYTKEDDGLSKAWYGNVWCNPPFGRVKPLKAGQRFGGGKSNFELFVTKLIREYQSGNVEQSILLATVKSDTKWFRSLWDFTICFTDHRIMFIRPELSHEAQMFGTALVYLGKNEQKFIEVFSQFGTIAKRVNPAPVKPSMCELWEVE